MYNTVTAQSVATCLASDGSWTWSRTLLADLKVWEGKQWFSLTLKSRTLKQPPRTPNEKMARIDCMPMRVTAAFVC